MKRQLIYMMSGVAIASLTVSAAEARPHHEGVVAHHHYRYHHHHYRYGTATAASIPYRAERPSFGNPYPVRPQYGYEEAPYNPGYQGPGAEVYRRTIESAHEPGVTLQLDPEAKETATGGPSGGIPDRSGGGIR